MSTITDHATASSTSSGATLDVTGITAAVGDFLVLSCAADNAGASGVSSTSTSITDGEGNTWTVRSQTTRTAGAANDGTTLSIWTCSVTNALVGDTVTINFSPNTAAKAAAVWKISPGPGSFVSVGAGASGNGTAWDAPTASVTLGETIFGFVSIESTSPQTPDTDTTNGVWSDTQQIGANGGTANTSQAVLSQYKTVTGTGNQTYNRVSSASRDWAANYLIVRTTPDGTAAGTSTATAVATISGTAAGTSTATAVATGFRGIAAGTSIAAGVPIIPDTTVLSAAITERPDRASGTIVPGWPSSLPLPSLQGYSFAPAAAVKRIATEFGAPRVYRRTRRPVIEVSVAWQVTATQQALLDGFQDAILQQGAQWFGIEMAMPGGLSVAVARFKDKLGMRKRGGVRWQTTATLEIQSRPIMTDAALTAIIGAGTDWPSTFLPYPEMDGWEFTPKPAVARSEDLPGMPFARQRSRSSTTEVPASWELSALQASIFDAFFTHRGKNGATWFDFPLVQALGEQTASVRFTGDADWTPRGKGRWSVTAPLEIRERRVMTSTEVTEALRA